MFFRSIAAAAAMLAAPAAIAQQVAPSQAQAQSFTEAQLRAFAAAIIELRALSEELSPRIRAASGADAQTVRQEAMGRAFAVIQKHELNPMLFQQIMQAAQQDQALDARIEGYIVELGGTPSPAPAAE